MRHLPGHWYVAAFISEVTTKPIRRVIFDEPVVLYRTGDGDPVALSDVCPHRRAPLHLGRVIGNEIACPYHGLRFDVAGRCSYNPNFKDVAPRVQVRRYALIERDYVTWISLDEAESADSRSVPDFSSVSAQELSPVHGYLNIKAQESLVSDNLLDLSHSEFLHPYLANEGVNTRMQQTIRQEGNTVFSDYSVQDEPMTLLLGQLWDKPPITHADMWFSMRWQPPSCLLLEIGATPGGRPKGEGIVAYIAHHLTPETASSTHYFWTFARHSRPNDPQFDAHLQASISQAFMNEDAPMIEWQQRYQQLPNRPPIARRLLRGDAGGATARRVIEELQRIGGTLSSNSTFAGEH